MLAKTLSTLDDINPLKIVQNPFWEVILDCIGHDNHYKKKLTEWDRSAACFIGNYNGSEFIGLRNKDSVSSVNLTETRYFPESGYYRIELRMRKHPNEDGFITLYVDDEPITVTRNQVSIPAYHQWDHIERVRYPVRWYNKGNHELKVHITRQAFVESIKIEKIDRYTDNSDGDYWPGTGQIDVGYFDFTQNSVNAINTGKLKMAMQDKFWNDEDDPYLPLQPGFIDSITIILGPDRQNAVPIFGGYCLIPNPKDTELTVDFVDRLLDLQRNMVYHNFSIGTINASNNTQQINYIKMGSVLELLRRLAETQEYAMQTYGVQNDFGFYKNFAGPYDFLDLQPQGWIHHRDPIHGMSPPCLKLTLPHYISSDPTPASITLFDDIWAPWDAAEYNMFFMHYYASGVGSRYPIQFNLQFTMHKKGESFLDAENYIVHVTGQDNVANEIGDFELIRDGTWRELTFDLKSLFDKYAPSGEYWITNTSIVGNITQTMIDDKKCSAIWLDNALSYKKSQHSEQYAGQNNVKDSLSEISDVTTKTNHVAYTRPGIERCEDVLVAVPEENQILPVTIDAASNLISIESWKNDPRGSGFCNQSHVSVSFSNNKSGTAKYEDQNSIDHFGPFEKHESASDINSQVDANKIAQNMVLNNKDANKIGFSVRIRGSPLLEIGQLMSANILSHRITGTHKIASITQTMDPDKADIWESKMDMNYPSATFLKRLELINNRKELRNLGLTVINQIYRNYSNRNIGMASPGAYGL